MTFTIFSDADPRRGKPIEGIIDMGSRGRFDHPHKEINLEFLGQTSPATIGRTPVSLCGGEQPMIRTEIGDHLRQDHPAGTPCHGSTHALLGSSDI
jgi:hypothetical protein